MSPQALCINGNFLACLLSVCVRKLILYAQNCYLERSVHQGYFTEMNTHSDTDADRWRQYSLGFVFHMHTLRHVYVHRSCTHGDNRILVPVLGLHLTHVL